MPSPLRLLVLLSAVGLVSATLPCLNEYNEPVDWWFIYKMPNGFDYAYHDNTDRTTTLKVFDRTLDRIDGALGNTLHQIYEDKDGLAYVLYNDEPPSSETRLRSWMASVVHKSLLKESKSGAHAKGVLAADSTSGFWLVHSVPKFPDLGPPDFTWTADDTYGQSFLCISLNTKNVEKAATQLQHYHPTIFDDNMPDSLAKKMPNFAGLLGTERLEGANEEVLHSLKGTPFHSFAKDHNWGQDLYIDLVSPSLKVGFMWETWRRGQVLDTVCGDGKTTFDAINVLSMQVGDYEFGYTHDHAKIGVATSSTSSGGYVCVGGINRMESQRKRGGGTVCFKSTSLFKALSSSIGDVEKC